MASWERLEFICNALQSVKIEMKVLSNGLRNMRRGPDRQHAEFVLREKAEQFRSMYQEALRIMETAPGTPPPTVFAPCLRVDIPIQLLVDRGALSGGLRDPLDALIETIEQVKPIAFSYVLRNTHLSDENGKWNISISVGINLHREIVENMLWQYVVPPTSRDYGRFPLYAEMMDTLEPMLHPYQTRYTLVDELDKLRGQTPQTENTRRMVQLLSHLIEVHKRRYGENVEPRSTS